MKTRCKHCSREWSGASPAHCSGCHKTFATSNAFDLHQRLKFSGTICKDPASVGLVYDQARNLYRFMSPDEEQDSRELPQEQAQKD